MESYWSKDTVMHNPQTQVHNMIYSKHQKLGIIETFFSNLMKSYLRLPEYGKKCDDSIQLTTNEFIRKI